MIERELNLLLSGAHLLASYKDTTADQDVKEEVYDQLHAANLLVNGCILTLAGHNLEYK